MALHVGMICQDLAKVYCHMEYICVSLTSFSILLYSPLLSQNKVQTTEVI